MLIKTKLFPDGVDVPYIIKVEKPRYVIGIFGDSFAELAENARFQTKKWQGHTELKYNHENSWQYFLANLLSVETHSYGISGAGMGDICDLIIKSHDISYDYYIIFHTNPLRIDRFGNPYTKDVFLKVNTLLQDKEVLNIYWNKKHKLRSFGSKEYFSKFHITNPNMDEVIPPITDLEKNPLDILGSTAHMSARGNLLLAIDLHKIIASHLKF